MLKLQEGQKVLIIRYGKKNDCIKQHREVIDSIGYCWFGKIGVVPSKKAIEAITKEEAPKIVLYSQGKGYIADVSEISYEKPDDGYPEYYKAELFDELIFPKSYFKLLDIQDLSSEDLIKLMIVSSGSPAVETLNRSMSSFFFAEYGKPRPTENKQNKKVVKSKKKELDINDCVYKKNGICKRKGFVSYEFECSRPSTCMGQKR